jgi:hypothetical protein
MNVVPRWIKSKAKMTVVSLRPRYPTIMSCAYRISESENVLIIKDWSHILNDRREVLGGSNKKRKPQ